MVKGKDELSIALFQSRTNLSKGKDPFLNLKEKEIKGLQERYSIFKDMEDANGFVVQSTHYIHNPLTPRPYFHALNNFTFNGAAYGSIWDQTGRGYSYLNTVIGGEITSNTSSTYKPFLADKHDRRIIYLREETPSGAYTAPDGKKVDIWPLFPVCSNTAREYSEFSSTQNPTNLEVCATRNQVTGRLTVTIPRGASCEIMQLTLKNESAKKRVFSLFFRIDWDLKAYPSPRLKRCELFDMQIDRKLDAIMAKNIDWTNKNPRTGFCACDQKMAGFELSGERFEGTHTFNCIPVSVLAGSLQSGTCVPVASSVIAGIHCEITLPPKSAKTLYFTVGAVQGDYTDAKKTVEKIKRQYMTDKAFAATVKNNEEEWLKFSTGFLVNTPDAEFNRFFNVWTTSQLVNTALFLSGASKFEFREKMQVLKALVPYCPEVVKKELKATICYQLRDGRAISRYSKFKDHAPDEEVTMDNTMWMVDAVCRYVNDTGDFSFLEESIGFFDPKMQVVDNTKNAKVYDHVILAVKCLFDYRGRFGLCKVGSGDMNTALTHITKLGGVSAGLSMVLVYIAKLLFPYARERTIKRDIGYLNTILENMYSNLGNYSWNGESYAYDDNGNTIGAKGDKDGAIHLFTNLWAIICGAVEASGNLKAVLTLLDRMDTPFGFRSIHPPYSIGFSGKGGIPDILPGTFENGSIDAYGKAFSAFALAEIGQGQRAFKAIKKAFPSCTLPDISTANPNQVSEFTIGPGHCDFGKNVFDIFTPAISWIKIAMERIIGVVPTYEGLLLSPSIPPEWKEFSVVRTYREKVLSIKFHNPHGKETGVAKATVNGKELQKSADGRFIIDSARLAAAGKNNPIVVDVLMG